MLMIHILVFLQYKGVNNCPIRMSGRITADVEMNSHSGIEEVPYVHKVGKPPKQDLLKEINIALKGTFILDESLKPFKDQPRKKKFVIDLQAFFPILNWGREYKSLLI
ncbi:putative SLC26A/SulP transporter [Helianthus anomalus]